MKPRKVVVVIELRSEEDLNTLRSVAVWDLVLRYGGCEAEVRQVQANIVKPEKGGKAR